MNKKKVFEVSDIDISQESIKAYGNVNMGGWKDAELIPRPASLGKGLEFDFVAQPPDGSVAQVRSPIEAIYKLSPKERGHKDFIIYADRNQKRIFLGIWHSYKCDRIRWSFVHRQPYKLG